MACVIWCGFLTSLTAARLILWVVYEPGETNWRVMRRRGPKATRSLPLGARIESGASRTLIELFVFQSVQSIGQIDVTG